MSAGELLVRLPSWLGDMVAVEPAVRALAQARGAPDGAGLALAGPEHLLPLVEGWLPGARRIAHAGRGGERADAWRSCHTALLLTGSFRSAWTAWRAGIPRRIGWARDARGLLLTDGVRPTLERGRSAVGPAGRWPRYLPRSVTATSIELVGLLDVPVRDPVPRLAPDPSVAARVAERLEAAGVNRAPVVINVGGRPESAKAWPAQWWARAAASIDPDLPLVAVAGPGEERAIEALARAARPRAVFAAWPDRAADLPELLALAQRAAVFVTADAGPRHVARAAGAPTVVLFGPTDPRHTAAPGPAAIHLREPVPCAPCHRERCPLSGDDRLRCQSALEPAAVGAAVRALLVGAGEGRAG